MNKKIVSIIILVSMLISMNNTKAMAIEKQEKITISAFVERLVKASKGKLGDTTGTTHIDIALEVGIIKENEFNNYNKNITREDAAVLANRTDELLGGTTYNKKIINSLEYKKRISDMSKIKKSKREDVIKLFSKGIMVGESNGMYSQSRKFNGKGELTLSEAKTIIDRIINEKKRKLISPDGQVIRTTKLPKNYKKYEYILESFPNDFYEMKFNHQVTRFGAPPIVLVDYAPPSRVKEVGNYRWEINEYSDMWFKKIETNLNTRINANYKTIGREWIKTLRSTYYFWEDEDDIKKTKHIEDYVKIMKKNQVIIKGKAVVEPSTLYYESDGLYVRTYIKLKITSAKNMNVEQNKLLYGRTIQLTNLKKNNWYEGYFDVCIASYNGSSDGRDYSADFYDSLFDKVGGYLNVPKNK